MRRWNDDPFTKKAQKENYEARSVYKLEEIDRRERLFDSAKVVLDLGASPGSWTQFSLRRSPSAKVVAVDLAPINVKDPRLTFHQKDIAEISWDEALSGEKADLVLSDMAPKTSGIRDLDTARSFDLASIAVDVAQKTLKPSGKLVVKIFMGDTFDEFEKRMRETFKEVRRLRPETTRKHSREIYFIGKGLKAPAGISGTN